MGIYQISHKMRWLLQECRNIWYYESDPGEPSVSEWQDIVDEIRGDYDTHLKTSCVPEWEFYGIDYRRVDIAGLPSFSAVPTAGTLVGTSAADTLPTQVALLATMTGSTTKPNRIRKYFCGLSEGNVTDGLFGAGVQSNVDDFVTQQVLLNFGGTNELSIVSAQWNSSHTQVTVTNSMVTAFIQTFAVPATQRRRRIGVGI